MDVPVVLPIRDTGNEGAIRRPNRPKLVRVWVTGEVGFLAGLRIDYIFIRHARMQSYRPVTRVRVQQSKRRSPHQLHHSFLLWLPQWGEPLWWRQ